MRLWGRVKESGCGREVRREQASVEMEGGRRGGWIGVEDAMVQKVRRIQT